MSRQNTSTRSNGVKVTVTHDWIRIDLGNGRGLTTAFGGMRFSPGLPVEGSQRPATRSIVQAGTQTASGQTM